MWKLCPIFDVLSWKQQFFFQKKLCHFYFEPKPQLLANLLSNLTKSPKFGTAKRVCVRDGKNCKAGRQTSRDKAALVWKREKRKRLRWEKDNKRWRYLEKEREESQRENGRIW